MQNCGLLYNPVFMLKNANNPVSEVEFKKVCIILSVVINSFILSQHSLSLKHIVKITYTLPEKEIFKIAI